MAFDIAPISAEERRFDLGIQLPGAAGTIGLHCVCASLSNRALFAAQSKRSQARRARALAGVTTPESALASRLEDAKDFARHVVKRWDNVTENGQPLAITVAKCEELLTEVAKNRPSAFYAFVSWATDESNFVDSIGDPVELGK